MLCRRPALLCLACACRCAARRLEASVESNPLRARHNSDFATMLWAGASESGALLLLLSSSTMPGAVPIPTASVSDRLGEL